MTCADGFANGHTPAGVPADADLEADLELVVIRKVIPAGLAVPSALPAHRQLLSIHGQGVLHA